MALKSHRHPKGDPKGDPRGDPKGDPKGDLRKNFLNDLVGILHSNQDLSPFLNSNIQKLHNRK